MQVCIKEHIQIKAEDLTKENICFTAKITTLTHLILLNISHYGTKVLSNHKEKKSWNHLHFLNWMVTGTPENEMQRERARLYVLTIILEGICAPSYVLLVIQCASFPRHTGPMGVGKLIYFAVDTSLLKMHSSPAGGAQWLSVDP